MIRRLDDQMAVAPQVAPDDLSDIAAMGFTAIINNRPDGEEVDQPVAAAIRAAAEAAGLAYVEIPVTHAGFSAPQLAAFRDAVAAAGGPVLAFCRSGTRSCNLWALASAQGGADPDELIEKAGAAGYDLSGIAPTLQALAARG